MLYRWVNLWIEFCATSVGYLKDAPLFERGWDGGTLNALVAVARLCKTAGDITRVGDDEFGRCFLEMWQREGIDTSHVIVEKGDLQESTLLLITGKTQLLVTSH